MKLIKRIAIGFSALLVLLSAALIVADLYTKEKTDTLAKEMVGHMRWGWANEREAHSNPKPFYLGDLLYANIYANGKEGEDIRAGRYTPQHYKDGFRAMVANNPSLAYKAVELYGDYFIERFNARLKELHTELTEKYANQTLRTDTSSWYSRRDKKTYYTYKHYTANRGYEKVKEGDQTHFYYNIQMVKDSLANFSVDRYWNRQKYILGHYKKLIDGLLALKDKKLNAYIENAEYEWYSAADVAALDPNTNIVAWMIQEELMPPFAKKGERRLGDPLKQGSWYFTEYPGDLIQLTRRIHTDYPKKWPPRKFLSEVKKFIEVVEKKLP